MNRLNIFFFVIFSCSLSWGTPTEDSLTHARLLLQRLTGTRMSATNTLVQGMALRIENGDLRGAAELGMSHKNFYNVTVKLMASRMATREEENQPLNDFSASFIGVVRDGVDARELLSGNFSYRGKNMTVPSRDSLVTSNKHFADLDFGGRDLSAYLVRHPEQYIEVTANAESGRTVGVLPEKETAGVLTSRTFLTAHAIDGTNRRPVEYSFREFLCIPIEEWADASAPDNRIGRDIDRFPGDDHLKFQSTCKACHSVMDGFRGAFAKVAINNGPIHANYYFPIRNFRFREGVASKLNRNVHVYPGGYQSTDSSFVNNANSVANEKIFGWRGPFTNGGENLKEFGSLVANSKRFSQCMAKRVFDAVCKANLDLKKNQDFIKPFAEGFEKNNYDFKYLFRELSIVKRCRSGV